MAVSESVAKGCFPFKGKKKCARAEDYLPTDNSQAAQRYNIYKQMWTRIDNKFQELHLEVNNKVFEDLLLFVGNGHQQFGRHLSVREIPTAAFITGVNTSDHSAMFSNLFTMLQASVTSLVAMLHAKDCTSVKSLMCMMLKQLLALPDLNAFEEGENTQVPSMLTLLKHYNARNQCLKRSPKKSSPKKRRSLREEEEGKHPVIVVMLDDTENFPPHVLQDFIVICSNHLDRLPLVLVLGIATSVTTVHRLLPTSVSSLLCMEVFRAPPSSQYLNLLIDKILMTGEFPFRLGPKVFQLLLDLFLFHHLSVINFVTAFQFCLLDHYVNNPWSHLCCPVNMVSSTVDNLSSKDLLQLQQLPSVMRYMEQMSPNELANMLHEEENFRKLIKKLLKENPVLQDQSTALLRFLHSLTSHLPTCPLGKQVREVYAACLEADVDEMNNFTKAFDLLGMTARDELISLVTQAMQEISCSSDPLLRNVGDRVQQFVYRLNHLEDEVAEDTENNTLEHRDLKLQKTDLRSLQKKLREMGKKKTTPYEKVRQEMLTYLRDLMKKCLHKAEKTVLYEVFYYDNVTAVQQQLHASPRSAIHRALGDPEHYLQCQCCALESGCISAKMPDISIAYKLHLECGSMINLYDWLQAFVSVVISEDQDKKSAKHEKMMQARFIQAVSELQFLGFIKPTRRKTDHVSRLTWGGC